MEERHTGTTRGCQDRIRGLNMKRLIRSFICVLLIAGQAWAGITYHGTTGQTLYARIQTGASTFEGIALTEGTSGGLGVYSVADGTIDNDVTTSSAAAGYPNGYPFTIRSGTASDTANDTILATGQLPWSGSVEIPTPADARMLLGTAWLTPGTAGTPDVNVKLVGSTTQTAGDLIKEARLRGMGRTWCVATTGNDANAGTNESPFLTIAAAITASRSGDTIFVKNGTFTEDLDFDGGTGAYVNRTLVGASRAATIIQGSIIAADGMTFRNLTIDPSATTGDSAIGIRVDGADGVTVEECTINASTDCGLRRRAEVIR